ncbi:calcium-binding protein [Actinoplanes sp. NPDC049118]|uniref:calcium-binding protein n=1 Tax=Actinoplanes sp. NPDC049118 TaxID=3155769 RepID=UPI00340BAE01
MSRSVWLSRVGVALLVTISAGGLAAPARAAATGVASVYETTKVQYKAATGKQNKIVVTRSGNTITIDDTVTVKAGKGCKAVKGDKTRATCKTSKAPTRVRVYSGDRNDSISNKTNLAITADGGTGNDTITGGALADTLRGRDGADTIWAGGGRDSLHGDAGADRIYGGAGDDMISGGTGNDRIDGQWDNDFVGGDEGNDVLYGGTGIDHVNGQYGDDNLYGGAGGDWLQGDSGKDRVYGDAGHDFIYAHSVDDAPKDADYYAGGSDTDTVTYGSYRVAITADADGVQGDDGASGEHDTIAADVEELFGGAGNDRLYGTAGDNYLRGYEGNDTILGGGGDDLLRGDEGKDQLDGQAGDDHLLGDEPELYAVQADVLLGGPGVDAVSYGSYTTAISVDLDGARGDDGQAGEGDTVGSDVETIFSGSGDDHLTGNDAANKITGDDGDDVIRGGGADDWLFGGNGDDQLFGEAGDDSLTGDDGVDRLDGGDNATEAGDRCTSWEPDVNVDCER